MNRHRFIFDRLQTFMKENDNISLDHILRWEYRKESLFQLRNDDGLTLVHQACLDGQLKSLHILIRHGASPHVKSSVGWTPLHAATLGGNKDIVSYLLKDCSADPLAKDEMNCLPLDLTMDKSIRLIIEEAMQNFRLKKHLESFNSRIMSTPKKRLMGTRSQSMFIGDEEASKLRNTLTKDDNDITGTVLKSSNDVFDSTFSRLGVHSIRRKGAIRKSSSSKELHNDCVMREKSTNAKTRQISTLPRAIKFKTSRKRNTSSSSGTSNTNEISTKHRDSGIFDEETDTDIGKNISNNEIDNETIKKINAIQII